jgi:acyl-coenzyme A thioesterase PaaI-like protein
MTSPASQTVPPEIQPLEGWQPVNPFASLGATRSFVSGEEDDRRLRVAYFRRERDSAIVGRVWFGPGTEGPPGCAHGGSVAAVLDEAMGAAAWHAGHSVLAARLTVDFRQLVTLGTDAVLETWVDRVEGRKVTTRGRLTSEAGEIYAESEGLFIMLDPAQKKALLERLGR